MGALLETKRPCADHRNPSAQRVAKLTKKVSKFSKKTNVQPVNFLFQCYLCCIHRSYFCWKIFLLKNICSGMFWYCWNPSLSSGVKCTWFVECCDVDGLAFANFHWRIFQIVPLRTCSAGMTTWNCAEDLLFQLQDFRTEVKISGLLASKYCFSPAFSYHTRCSRDFFLILVPIYSARKSLSTTLQDNMRT